MYRYVCEWACVCVWACLWKEKDGLVWMMLAVSTCSVFASLAAGRYYIPFGRSYNRPVKLWRRNSIKFKITSVFSQCTAFNNVCPHIKRGLKHSQMPLYQMLLFQCLLSVSSCNIPITVLLMGEHHFITRGEWFNIELLWLHWIRVEPYWTVSPNTL